MAERRRNGARVAASRVALALAGLAAILGGLELALRATTDYRSLERRPWAADDSAYVDHPFLPFVGRAGMLREIDCPSGDEPTCRIRHNAHGFRTHEFPASKAPEDLFVVCLGGSTTWGAAAPTNAETWPEQLERLLQQRYPHRRVRVFNFGTTLANSAYSAVAFGLIGAHLRPDIVVVYHGFNDDGPMNATNYLSDLSHFYRDLGLPLAWHGTQTSLPSWLRRSYAAMFVTDRIDRLSEAGSLSFYTTWPLPARKVSAETAAARVVANLETIATMARSVGAVPVLATFQFFDPSLTAYRGAVNEAIRAHGRRTGTHVIDLDRAIPDYSDDLQFDDCHFTARGRERVATEVFAGIVERNLIADPSPRQ